MPSLRKTKRYNKNKRRLKKSSNKSRKMRGGWGWSTKNRVNEDLLKALAASKNPPPLPPLSPWDGNPVTRLPYQYKPPSVNTSQSFGYDGPSY